MRHARGRERPKQSEERTVRRGGNGRGINHIKGADWRSFCGIKGLDKWKGFRGGLIDYGERFAASRTREGGEDCEAGEAARTAWLTRYGHERVSGRLRSGLCGYSSRFI